MSDRIRYNIQDWCKAFNQGKFDAPDFDTQCNAGWYDWFCKESSLARKTQKLGKFLCRIRDSQKLDFKHHVWFKNNCPCRGPLYDDIRFTDETKDCNAFVIAFGDKRNDFDVEVVDVRLFDHDAPGCDNQERATVFQGTVAEAIKWFNQR